jgi:hypothetical protein
LGEKEKAKMNGKVQNMSLFLLLKHFKFIMATGIWGKSLFHFINRIGRPRISLPCTQP